MNFWDYLILAAVAAVVFLAFRFLLGIEMPMGLSCLPYPSEKPEGREILLRLLRGLRRLCGKPPAGRLTVHPVYPDLLRSGFFAAADFFSPFSPAERCDNMNLPAVSAAAFSSFQS